MSSPPASSPPPQAPTDDDNTNSPQPQAEGDSAVQGKKADFWPIVFRCMDTEPKINYDKLATEMGYKSAKVARDSYCKKLKKLGVERTSLKTRPENKIAKAQKAQKAKPKPTKDSTQRKSRVRKPAAKKAEEQEDGPEKVAEEA